MQNNLERVGIGCDDDQFGDGSVQSLSSLVGSFFDLLESCALSNEVVDH